MADEVIIVEVQETSTTVIEVGADATGDMHKATYDPTGVGADAFSMGNMVETSTKKVLTSAERDKLTNTSGTNTGDQDLGSLDDVNYVEYNNTPTGVPTSIGTRSWDASHKTTKLQLEHGSELVDGQELLRYVHNDSGADIPNGKAVYFSGTNVDGHREIALADASSSDAIDGMTTTAIADGGTGWVVISGVAHDVDVTGLTIDLPVYVDPATPGDLTNTIPTYPDYVLYVGTVTKVNGGSLGNIDVIPHVIQREVPTPVILSSYSPSPENNATEDIHGGLLTDAAWTGHNLSAGDLTITDWGIGKVLIVVNAGSDLAGDITITGTVVDRDTGVETPGQSSVITVDALTTDTSGTDVNGISYYDFQHAYISDKWFSGSANVVVTSADTALTDIDVYQISFEQFNDASYIDLDAADMTYRTGTAPLSPISAYIYTVEVTGDVANLTKQGEHVLTAAQHNASRMYRIRRGNLGITLDGTTDGVFITIFFGGIGKFKNASIKIWGNVLY